MAESKRFKLTYFDIRGLAEVTRLLFAAAKVEYEDTRFPLTFGTPGDFSTIVRKEFDAAKEAGELDAAMGKLPVLEYNGVKVGQSKAIERFVAKKVGLMGSNEAEEFQIDSIACHVIDIKDAYKAAKTAGADDKEVAMKKWFEETLPELLAKVEKSLPVASGPWLVGNKISYADVSFYYFLRDPKGFFDDIDGAAKALATAPRLNAACEAVFKDEGISAWLAKRPEGTAPF
jgi:glutathione S-transferase